MMLTVGQKLVVAPRRRGLRPHWTTVIKVGRKWAAIDGGGRIDIETLRIDGGDYSSPGRCYLSLDDWQRERRAQKSWGALQSALQSTYEAPEGVDDAAIREAARLLHVPLPADEGEPEPETEGRP